MGREGIAEQNGRTKGGIQNGKNSRCKGSSRHKLLIFAMLLLLLPSMPPPLPAARFFI